MKTSPHKWIGILLVLAVLLSYAAPALAAEYVFVQKNTRVYTLPSGKGGAMGSLKVGDSVEKTGIDGIWTAISYNNKTGYIQTADIVGHAPKEETRPVKAKKSGNVRSGPSTSYKKVGSLKKGSSVVYVKTEGDWAEIQFNGEKAYTMASFLDLSDVQTSVSGGSSSKVTMGKGDIQLEVYLSKTVLKKGETIKRGFGTAKVTYKGSKRSATIYGDEILCSVKSATGDWSIGGISKLDILTHRLQRNTPLAADILDMGFVLMDDSISKNFSATGELALPPGQYVVVANFNYDDNDDFKDDTWLKIEIPITVLAA